jgi:histidyl-tRNA synthetase
VGSASLVADAEVIATLEQAFKALEVGEVEVKFNNRELIDQVLSKLKVSKKRIVEFMRTIDKLDKLEKKKVEDMLKRAGFEPDVLDAYYKLMKADSKAYVAEMENLLSGFGVSNMVFDPFLARGLDYYTGTIFEFVLVKKPEFGSIAGGGRYDNLIEQISGKPMPAVGGSIGLDRLFAALSELGLISPQTAAEVLIMNLDKKLQAEYLNIATNLRSAGIDAEVYYDPAKLDKQFKYAEAKNMKLAIILGPDEAKNRKINIKDLAEKKQRTIDQGDLVSEVKSMLW